MFASLSRRQGGSRSPFEGGDDAPLRYEPASARRRGRRVSISHLVEGFIASAGYPAVFALVGAESLGIPLPGETALVLASIYAGDHSPAVPLAHLRRGRRRRRHRRQHRLLDRCHRRIPAGPPVRAQGAAGRAEAEGRPVPVRPSRREAGLLRPLYLRAANLRGVPGRNDQDAVAAVPGRQRRRRYRVGRDLHRGRVLRRRSAAAAVPDDRPRARRHRRTGDRPRRVAAPAAAGRAERARRKGVPRPPRVTLAAPPPAGASQGEWQHQREGNQRRGGPHHEGLRQ